MPKLDHSEHDVDALIGERIRVRRIQLGLSQADLAALIGMSFQQVQKYERGSNRIASSILLRVSDALKCSPNYFFGAEKESKARQRWITEIEADRKTAKLMQRFYKITSPAVRRRILLVLDALLYEAESAAPVVKAARRKIAAPAKKAAGSVDSSKKKTKVSRVLR